MHGFMLVQCFENVCYQTALKTIKRVILLVLQFMFPVSFQLSSLILLLFGIMSVWMCTVALMCVCFAVVVGVVFFCFVLFYPKIESRLMTDKSPIKMYRLLFLQSWSSIV